MEELYYKNTTLTTLDGEEWVDIINYDGIYTVSNLGRVKSEERRVATAKGDRKVRERILSQAKSKDGRLTVNLALNGTNKSMPVSQLVYYSFNPDKLDDTLNCEVYHKNKIDGDNRLVNLGWNKVKGTSYKISIDLGNVTHLKEARHTPQEYSQLNSVIENNRVIVRKCKCCEQLIPQKQYSRYGINTCNACRYTKELARKK